MSAEDPTALPPAHVSSQPGVSVPPESAVALGEALRVLAQEPAVHQAIRSFGEAVREFIAPLQGFLRFVGSATLFLVKVIAALPEKLQAAVLKLATRGWFFDPQAISIYWSAELLIAEGKVEEADRLMAAHFERRLPEIEERLCARLPHRAAKFRSALAAHRRGEFDLSVLALLAQADGVCKELRGGHFFLRDRRTQQPAAAAYAQTLTQTALDEIVYMALTTELPLKTRLDRLAVGDRNTLNRHAVMHGESLDYDTKENSLRALSLLNYVALALEEAAAQADSREGPPLDALLRTVSASIPSKRRGGAGELGGQD